MSVSLKLHELEHDLIIKNGTFATISGVDEIRQRIIVALKHFFGEYKFDRTSGVPWYQRILGMKGRFDTVTILLRNYISGIRGVVSVQSVQISRSGRDYQVAVRVSLAGGEDLMINDIQIEVE